MDEQTVFSIDGMLKMRLTDNHTQRLEAWLAVHFIVRRMMARLGQFKHDRSPRKQKLAPTLHYVQKTSDYGLWLT